jgi:hypothetical protein
VNHKVLTTRKKSNQSYLALLSGSVIYKLENNPTFPNPPAALAVLKKVLPEYRIALADALSRDKEKVAIKDKKKELVVNLLNELADYVNAICKGNRILLLGSGFDITPEGKANLSPSIEKLEVLLSAPGEATARIKNAKGAIAFIFEYTTEPPGPNTIWTYRGSSLRTYTFKGLASDKRHWFRTIAIGNGGLLSYSPIETKVIQ